MRAWVLHDINDIRMEEVEKPVPGPGEALVRVMAAGICGSDIPRIFKTGAHNMPLIPGHEFSGVVEAVGDDPHLSAKKPDIPVDDGMSGSCGVQNEDIISRNKDSFSWVGKKVGVFPLIPCRKCEPCRQELYEMCNNYNYLGSRCDGGFAEYVKVPVSNLIEIPGEISFKAAAMLEPMAVAVHAMRAMEKLLQVRFCQKTENDGSCHNEKNDDGQNTGFRQGNTNLNEYDNTAGTADCFEKEARNKIRIAICGAGTIGLLLCMVLKAEGYGNISVIGNKKTQREPAMKAGAARFLMFSSETNESDTKDSVTFSVADTETGRMKDFVADSATDSAKDFEEDIVKESGICSVSDPMADGFDVYFECVGKNETLSLGIEKLLFYGALITVGNPYSDMSLERNTYWKILRKQLTIRGVWNSSFTGRDDDDWHHALRLMNKAKVAEPSHSGVDDSGPVLYEGADPACLITHLLSFEDLEKGLAVMRDKSEYYCKVMIM